MQRLLVLIAAVAALGASTAAGSRAASPLGAALAAGLREAGAPGAQAAIYRCGRLVWSGAAGVLDRRTRRPVTRSTRFVLASTTKTVTATMIMQLVERGRLSLDTPVADFYPALPNAARITVRMLLRHTSGLPEYLDDPAVESAAEDPRHRWTRGELLAALRRAVFAPGARYRYTNSNFVVLGGILVAAGGKPVEQAFRDGIAKPLGLTHSSFVSAPGSSLFAHPYAVQDDRTATDLFVLGYGIPSDTVGPVWTDGELASTAEDIARFGDALFGGRLVRPETLARMTSLDRYDGGLGLYADDSEGRTWLGHSGSYGGFESELWYDASRGVTIAATTNMDEPAAAGDTSSDTIWVAVAEAYGGANPDLGACA